VAAIELTHVRWCASLDVASAQHVQRERRFLVVHQVPSKAAEDADVDEGVGDPFGLESLRLPGLPIPTPGEFDVVAGSHEKSAATLPITRRQPKTLRPRPHPLVDCSLSGMAI